MEALELPEIEPDYAGEVDDRPEITPEYGTWLSVRQDLGRSLCRATIMSFACALFDYTPNSWQAEFHVSGATYDKKFIPLKAAVVGRGGGKTTGLMAEFLAFVIANPGTDNFVLASSYHLTKNVHLPEFLRLCELAASKGYPLIKKIHITLLRIDLHCGGRIFFRSFNKVDNLRGFECANFFGDEWDFGPRPSYAFDLIRATQRDKRSIFPQGLIATTPAFYTGSIVEVFAEARTRAKRVEDPDERERQLSQWFFFRAPSHRNEYLLPATLASYAQFGRAQYEREILAIIQVHRTARVYPAYSYETHTLAELPDGSPLYDKKRPFDLSYDFGLQKAAILFIQDHGDFAVVFQEFMPDNLDGDHQLDTLMRMFEVLKKHPARASMDRADPAMIKKFRRLCPKTEIVTAITKEQQSRTATTDALSALIDPVQGKPKLYVSRKLTGPDASPRGIHQALSRLSWVYDRANQTFTDDAEKDGLLEHSAESMGYWAKLIGLGRSASRNARTIAMGGDTLAREMAKRESRDR